MVFADEFIFIKCNLCTLVNRQVRGKKHTLTKDRVSDNVLLVEEKLW
jgi:hypothetical protein